MDTYLWMRGNLVGDPRQTIVGNGLKVTKFRMAANGRRFDQALGSFVNTEPVFMNVACWRQLGDNVMQSLRKGDTVIVQGKLRYSEYDDANGGQRRSSYEIEASTVGPDLNRYVTPLTRLPRDLPTVPDQPAQGPDDAAPASWEGGGVVESAESAA